LDRNFDLLGDPVPEGRGAAGRTGHIATEKNVNKVRMLLLSGWSKGEIAKELGVTSPTLNKHYFQKLSVKQARLKAISETKGRTLLQLDKAAQGGSVSAMKEISKQVKAIELECLASDIRSPKKEKALGVKAQRKVEAAPDGSWGFLNDDTKHEVH
jgi:hypothetical protein